MDLEKEIEKLIDIAIHEDVQNGDITTEACIPLDAHTSGKFILKQAGTLAGLPFLAQIFKKIDPRIEVEISVPEGSYQKAGTVIARIHGPARGILTGERVALNLIQHASGVATITSAYIKKVAGLKCSIMDTRKTLPGLRALEKYSVKIAGGKNHRFGLSDRCIIKTNHLTFVSGGSKHPIRKAFEDVKSHYPHLEIEIEVEDGKMLDEALQTTASAIILRNMPPEDARKYVGRIKKTNKKVYIESAGPITLETVRAYAETGLDGISLGDLTHPNPLDIAMRLF